jgi:hypothetical protein
MIELIFIGHGPGGKPVKQSIHDNDRINQCLVIGQEKNGTAIILNTLQSAEMNTIPEPKQQGENEIYYFFDTHILFFGVQMRVI